MLPEYRPEPVKTGSFKNVVVIMLVVAVAAAGFFLFKPNPPAKLADYKLQYKIEEPIISAIKNDSKFVDSLKDMNQKSGKQKLVQRINQLVAERKNQIESELALTIPDRVVTNAKEVLSQRLSDYVWKEVSSGRKTRRYLPGKQRPLSPSENGKSAGKSKPNVVDGSTRNDAKPNTVPAAKPSKNGIPSQDSR